MKSIVILEVTSTYFSEELPPTSGPKNKSRMKAANKFMFLTVMFYQFLATDPEIRVRFLALPDFVRSSRSGTGSTQPHEYN
jgi:hypothetical protein